ncbi:MAG: hypothetical protein GY765_06775 [bacterium]|nr:hypothetical protein [bacterium]
MDREKEIPYFCWDRNMTEQELETRLATLEGAEKDRLMAWLMREAAFRDVWRFVTPKEVAERLPGIQHMLGRWRGFWNYIIGAWRELGKI